MWPRKHLASICQRSEESKRSDCVSHRTAFLNTDSQAKEEGLKETLEKGGWSKEASEMEELINSKTTPVPLVWTYF